MFALRSQKKLKQLQNSDVEKHYHELVRYLANHDAPLDYLIAGELAQIQTFGVPTISKILRRTKQYQDHGTKRLDDTRAILVEIMKDTVHSQRGAHMVQHLNWIHGHYEISNDDYLYTLALFLIEPDRWMSTFGYRKLTDVERHAAYLDFRDLGEAMNIKDIPADFESFKVWYQNYRRRNLEFHPDNKVVAQGLIDGMKPMVPFLLRPFIQSIMLVLLNDNELLDAIGMKRPSIFMRFAVKSLMKVRATALKVFNPWQHKAFENGRIAQHYPTYPQGYEGELLGPQKVVRHAPSGSGCPYNMG